MARKGCISRGINLWVYIYQISGIGNTMFRLFGTLPFNIDPWSGRYMQGQTDLNNRLFSFFFFVNEQTLTTGPLHLLLFLNALPSDILKAPSCLTILLYSHCPFLPWSSCKNSTPPLTFSTSLSWFIFSMPLTTMKHTIYLSSIFLTRM